MDETYFLYSEKGQRKIKGRNPRKRGGSAKKRVISNEQVCVLVARDRDKTTFSEILGMGRLTKDQLDKAIGHKLSNGNVLCTNSWRAFKTYANEKGIDIYQFKSDGKVRTGDFITFRVLIITTGDLKGGCNVLTELLPSI